MEDAHSGVIRAGVILKTPGMSKLRSGHSAAVFHVLCDLKVFPPEAGLELRDCLRAFGMTGVLGPELFERDQLFNQL
jgi:hypothetical protein